MNEDTKAGILNEIYHISMRNFPSATISDESLEKIIAINEKNDEKRVRELPSMMGKFISLQQNGGVPITFADVTYMLQLLSESTQEEYDRIKSVMNKQPEVNNKTALIDIINLMEKGHTQSDYPHPKLEGSGYLLSDNGLSIKTNSLDRPRGLLVNHWKECRPDVQAGWRHLFEIERREPSFRAWLESKEYSQAIAKEFESLGINYQIWDDPTRAFTYSDNKLQEIKIENEHIVEEVMRFTRESTRGKYVGYLDMPPNAVFNKIKDPYLKLKDEKDETRQKIRAQIVMDTLATCFKKGATDMTIDTDKGNVLAKDFVNIQSKIKKEVTKINELPLLLKVWERTPSVDFYQGNDSGICTAFNGKNAEAMINYFIDKSVTVVEVDSKGKRYGQIYYLATYDSKREPVLIFDSMEISEKSPFNDSKAEQLYKAAEELTYTIAREAGFKQVFISGNQYWRHSSQFLDYMMHKMRRRHEHERFSYHGDVVIVSPNNAEYDTTRINKIGGMRSVKEELGHIHRQHNGFVGYKHYFDIFSIVGQADNQDWKDNMENFKVKGILIRMDDKK